MDNSEDTDVLDALQGIKCVQIELRQGKAVSRRHGVVLAARDARRLPGQVSKRLTELDMQLLCTIDFTDMHIDRAVESLLRQLESDKALAQVIRAANVYREKLGYRPLEPDGWPAKR